MKKILTILLSLCLLACFATCFAVSANAEEEIKVSVGSSFEWNDNSGDAKTQMAWSKSEGKSADGLWKYQYYSLKKGVYKDMVAFGKQFAWSSKATGDDYGIGYARVGEYGLWFHPGYAADAVKVFTCPSGGTIQISTEIARKNDLQADSNTTGTSFAIYVEDRVVPIDGQDSLTLVSSEPQMVDVTVDVAKGERVRIHIGCVSKTGTITDQNGDGVTMKNTITYKSINDDVAGDISDKTLTHSVIEGTYDQPTNIPNQGGNNNNNKLPTKNDGGISTGAIIGIVAGVVVVATAAVVVVIVLKKKKQD